MTTIPATPAKQTTTLPVRHVGILRTASAVGSYHTTNAVADMKLLGDLRHYDIYTLLPPHLADEWRRLRGAKADAEDAMYDGALASPPSQLTTKEAWTQFWNAQKALATFEAANGIGGGA